MELKLTIDCDKCTEDIEIEIKTDLDGLKSKLSAKNIMTKLKENDWHMLKTCLCAGCKSSIGNENCINCKHMDYFDHNYRCKRILEDDGSGLLIIDNSIVSEYDSCKHFESTD